MLFALHKISCNIAEPPAHIQTKTLLNLVSNFIREWGTRKINPSTSIKATSVDGIIAEDLSEADGSSRSLWRGKTETSAGGARSDDGTRNTDKVAERIREKRDNNPHQREVGEVEDKNKRRRSRDTENTMTEEDEKEKSEADTAFLSKNKGPGSKKTALADAEKGHSSLNEEGKLPTTRTLQIRSNPKLSNAHFMELGLNRLPKIYTVFTPGGKDALAIERKSQISIFDTMRWRRFRLVISSPYVCPVWTTKRSDKQPTTCSLPSTIGLARETTLVDSPGSSRVAGNDTRKSIIPQEHPLKKNFFFENFFIYIYIRNIRYTNVVSNRINFLERALASGNKVEQQR
ncbi:hypothetical protein ALC57_08103 [Trachymyrmex cornetzi]|uniref:Uncharacterized protein n=1 Tax=Trachymyrmex cornetzi TaxID=471704 RepID=A0A195E3Z1_9HYME|nr:hypothetical protein ALC57_08103 [Trachymyrmex cornetzi]